MRVVITIVAEELMSDEMPFQACVGGEVSALAAAGHRNILIRIMNAEQRAAMTQGIIDDQPTEETRMTERKHPHGHIPPSESTETKEGDVTGHGAGTTTDTAGSETAADEPGKAAAGVETDPEIEEEEDDEDDEDDKD